MDSKKRPQIAKAVQMLHDGEQSFWLDHLTRELLTSGALSLLIDEFAVTGMISSLGTLRLSIEHGSAYDESIRRKSAEGKSSEAVLNELLLDDAVWAADLLRPIWERSSGMEGSVSTLVSPGRSEDASGMLEAARDLHLRAGRPNVHVEIPGTQDGLVAVERAVAAGIPVNVTALFSAGQCRAAAEAYLRGLETRVGAGLDPFVGSVASMFVGGWGAADVYFAPRERYQLGLVAAKQAYKEYRALLRSPRWQRLFRAGARPQRLVWVLAGPTRGLGAELHEARALAAPFTVTATCVRTLKLLAAGCLDGISGAPRHAEEDLSSRLAEAGIDLEALARKLQGDAVVASVDAWRHLVDAIPTRRALAAAG